MKTLSIILASLICVLGTGETTRGAGQIIQVKYPPSTIADELQIGVTYTLWIPDGVKTLRAIIIHQHGAGTTASREGATAAYDLHWQALAKKWDCALLGPSYHVLHDQNDISPGGSQLWFDPRRGSEKAFLKALRELASKSAHPELETVPWALWGHSGGGIWSDVMNTLHPGRVAAMWLRSGSVAMFRTHDEFPQPQVPAAAYRVPIMLNPGVKEEPTFKPNPKGKEKGPWFGNLATFREYRAEGALIGFAPDPRTGHECGDSRYLAIPFLDACLAMRLPDKRSKDQALKPMDTGKAWLAPLMGNEAVPEAVFKGNPKEAVWLPNEAVARAWMEYVKTGAVSDTTPPPAPTNVRAWPKGAKGEDGTEIVWSAEADFESGIRGFIVLRDGQELAKLPRTPVGKFGRPLFQAMTYHDTPAQPLPEMSYLDTSAKAGARHTYEVITVNSVGLKSEPSVKVAPYPRVNTSTSYQVDPTWPQRPKGISWGPMSGVAVDAQENVWVLARSDPPVQVYQPDGKFLRAWGEGLMDTPHQLKLDRQGNVWLADSGNHVVLQCTPQGNVIRTLGTRGEPGCDERHFNRPADMVITPDGDVFIADGYGNARVVHFDKNGKFLKSWGKLGTEPGEFSLPHAIALDSRGRLYVADRNNVRIQVFDQDGKFLDEWRNIVVPCAFWMTKEDELWVCGSSPMPWRADDKVLGYPPVDQLFMKFNTSGKLLQLWSVPKGADGKERPGELNWAHGLAVDSNGNIYAVDIKGQRAQKFAPREPSPKPRPSQAAVRPRDYRFDKTISREVLDNYLSRAISMEGLLNGKGDFGDNIRMLKNIGAKFIGRSLCLWAGEANLLRNLERAKQQVPKVLSADTDMVLQACVFEVVSTQVEQVPVPDWAFLALGLPVENRNFRYADMIYSEGQRRNWGKNSSVPDVSRPETKLWFYFLAASFIDVGMEAIHFGQVDIMNRNDRDLEHWSQVLTLVRSYAAQHARRHMVLCDGHVPRGGLVRDGRLLLDFHSFPLRIMEVPDRPEEAILKVGFSDGLYGRSKGGLTFSGWKCDHLPYLAELDNWGVSKQPGKAKAGGNWVWGYDEISWFAHQSKQYRGDWLRYAWDWVPKTDPNGHLQMPGSRTMRSPLDGRRWYFANVPSSGVPDGLGDEEAIRIIWDVERAK
jgi:hypothetical protein